MALSIINKFTSVVVNTSFFFTNNMNQNDPIEAERLPETVATVSEQIAKLNERVVTLSMLAVNTDVQLTGIAYNSSEYKSLNAKVKGWHEEIARIKKNFGIDGLHQSKTS
jgi:spermidine/putrescine-binding protein